jgi:hypothetical protein
VIAEQLLELPLTLTRSSRHDRECPAPRPLLHGASPIPGG